MKLEDIIREAKRLRDSAERARSEFFIFLRRIERDEEETWGAAGCASFDMFLTTHHLCESAGYREFVAGMEVLGGEQAALTAGAEATRAARRLNAPGAAEQFVRQCEAFREVNGVAPSEETARGYVAQLQPRPPNVIRHASELHQLRAENARLKAELRQAQRKVKELERQLRKNADGRLMGTSTE